MQSKPPMPGYLVVSLDFELFWGMFDKVSIEKYGNRILGERTAIPRMLKLFEHYGVHATWATVGMLMAQNKEELLSTLPPGELQPTYSDPRISSYTHIQSGVVGEDESSDKYHFGSELVREILKHPHQEIGNHTFSHFYCIDGGENSEAVFASDIDAFNRIAKKYTVSATSIVFPRNQTHEEALRVCAQKGITAYRGNEDHFLYRARGENEQSLFIRLIRLFDHYINISGYSTYPLPKKVLGKPINVPASRFLRPWSGVLSIFEPLRIRRIKNAMTHAAKNGEVFHLWWHPHNFGINQDENFKNLESILKHFKTLEEQYGMQSCSIRGIAELTNTPH